MNVTRPIFALLVVSALLLVPELAIAQTATPPAPSAPNVSSLLPSGIGGPQQWTSPEGLSSTIQVMLLLTVISLAPALLLMTTSFIRILVVLGLLRQALGTQQLPPSQVITSIALFMTILLMTPVWSEVYDEAILPYTEKQLSLEEAWNRGTLPIRKFMGAQIDRTGNADDVYLFLNYMPGEIDPTTGELPDNYAFYAEEGSGNIIMPIEIVTLATTISKITNGR